MTTILACQAFATVDDVLNHESCTLSTSDTTEIEAVLDAGSDIIYALSNGRVSGTCTATVRPVHQGCDQGGMYGTYGVDCIPLADNTISVAAVKVDGVTLTADDYGLIDGHILFRKGNQWWPRTNKLWLPDTEPGTMSIRFSFGNPADWLAVAATAEVVIQLITDDRAGRGYLRGITSANVQGASVAIDQAAAGMAGRGLPMLERFLGVYAPHGGFPVGVWAPELANGWELVTVS